MTSIGWKEAFNVVFILRAQFLSLPDFNLVQSLVDVTAPDMALVGTCFVSWVAWGWKSHKLYAILQGAGEFELDSVASLR